MIGKSDIYAVANAIYRRENDNGLVREWFAGMRRWAEANDGPDAKALALWLDTVKPMPFYTADTLARFWPALMLEMGLSKRLEPTPPTRWFEGALQMYTKLPTLKNADGTAMFFHSGNFISRTPSRFFIVERLPFWREQVLTQEEFSELWFGNSE